MPSIAYKALTLPELKKYIKPVKKVYKTFEEQEAKYSIYDIEYFRSFLGPNVHFLAPSMFDNNDIIYGNNEQNFWDTPTVTKWSKTTVSPTELLKRITKMELIQTPSGAEIKYGSRRSRDNSYHVFNMPFGVDRDGYVTVGTGDDHVVVFVKKSANDTNAKKSIKRSTKSNSKKSTKRSTRPSPSEHAGEFKNRTLTGNDGRNYTSLPDKNGVYRWKLMK